MNHHDLTNKLLKVISKELNIERMMEQTIAVYLNALNEA